MTGKIIIVFLSILFFHSCEEKIITPDPFSIEKYNGSVRGIQSVSISSDGKVAAWAGNSNDIKIKNSFILSDHIGWINSVKLNKSGTLVISGSEDHNIKLWEVSRGILLRTFSEHITATKDVIFSPDEMSVISAEGNYVVYWKNAVSGFIAKLPLYGHTNRVTAVAMTNNMKNIISGSLDKTIKFWDAETGNLLHSIDAHEEPVRDIEVNPILNQFASCGDDSLIKIWDLNSYELIKTLKKDMGKIKSISYHYSGKYLAEGGDNNKIFIWDLENETVAISLEEHEATIRSLEFSSAGNDLISGDSGDKIIIWRNVFSKE